MRRNSAVVTLAASSALALGAVSLTAEEARPLFSQSSATPVPAPVADTPSRDAAQVDAEQAKLRLREGTRLRDVIGHFRQNGEILIFIDSEKREIGGLPNLNLERISRMLKTVEEPESIAWSITGTITEFSGKNFLLISRAVYKAATPPPAPESIAK